MDNDKLLIGCVLKPQGIAGEIKIKDFSDGISAIENVKKVFIKDNEYKVLNIRDGSGAIFISLSGIYDRNAAEELRGADIYCFRDEIKKADDAYFIVDIIGCDLFLSSGKNLGKIVDVSQANIDVYTVLTTEGNAFFPMLKELEPVFDLENKKITINAKKFTEVVMYEN